MTVLVMTPSQYEGRLVRGARKCTYRMARGARDRERRVAQVVMMKVGRVGIPRGPICDGRDREAVAGSRCKDIR